MFKNAIAYLVTPGFRLDPEMLAAATTGAAQAIQKLHDTAKAGGFTVAVEHNGEALATIGKEAA